MRPGSDRSAYAPYASEVASSEPAGYDRGARRDVWAYRVDHPAPAFAWGVPKERAMTVERHARADQEKHRERRKHERVERVTRFRRERT